MEAAEVHAGNFDRFEPVIRDRLHWGANFTSDEIATLRRSHSAFRKRMNDLFGAHDLILLPCASVERLAIGEAHSQTRNRLLRYRAPFSLAGVPTVVIPCVHGGVQLAASRDCDESLLQLAAEVGAYRKATAAA